METWIKDEKNRRYKVIVFCFIFWFFISLDRTALDYRVRICLHTYEWM